MLFVAFPLWQAFAVANPFGRDDDDVAVGAFFLQVSEGFDKLRESAIGFHAARDVRHQFVNVG